MRSTALRLVLALALAAPVGLAARAEVPAKPPVVTSRPPMFDGPEYVMGKPRARVTVVEYASVACPHCARFDATVWPAFKAAYVDTGKVRFIYREMLVGDDAMVQVAAGGYLLARCAGKPRYWEVVEDVYRAQPAIFAKGDVKGPFDQIARSVGLSDAQAAACLSDKTALDLLNKRVDDAETKAKVQGTPTFIVNGVKAFSGEVDLARLSAVVDAALKGRRIPPAPEHAPAPAPSNRSAG